MTTESHNQVPPNAAPRSTIGMAVSHPDGRLMLVNPTFCTITGYSESELLGTTLAAITHPDDREANARLLEQLLAGDRASFELEQRFVTKSAEVVWVLSSVSMRRGPGGHPDHLMTLCQDITTLKRASGRHLAGDLDPEGLISAEMLASQQHFWQLTEFIPGVVWTAQPDGLVDYANRYWLSFTGLTLDQTRGWGWAQVLHPDDLPRVQNLWGQHVARGEAIEVQYRVRRASDGAYRWCLARARPLRDDVGTIVRWFGTVTDIDERKTAERTLQESDQRTELLARVGLALNRANSLPAMAHECCQLICDYLGAAFCRIWMLNDDGQMLELKASAGMYTRLNGEFSRIRMGDFRIAAERRAMLINRVVGDPRIVNQEWARREGIVSFAAQPLLSGDRLVGVLGLFAKNPLAPETTSCLATIADAIALGLQRVYTENLLRAARAAADRASRAKSEFLSRMSHELRTPLNSVVGFTGLLRMEFSGPLNPEQKKQLEMVANSARLLLALINDLLDLSTIEADRMTVHWEWFSLMPLIEESCDSFAPQVSAKHLQLVRDFTQADIQINSDRKKCQQILLNLLNNAIKFTDEGNVKVSVRLLDTHIQIGIEDTGIGIRTEELPRLFQPFQRLNTLDDGPREGSGLGLHLCQRLCRLIGAEIQVESKYGSGSRFVLTLPKSPPDGAGAGEK
jgi:PAS domain S-box-containing protein